MSRVIICVSKSKMISLQKFHHLHCCNFAPWTTIPDLRILGDIPLYIEFYNETNEELTKGCVAICFGCVSFKDKSPSLPGLFVRASRLNPYVCLCYPHSYFTCPGSFPLLQHLISAGRTTPGFLHPAMMNAFLDFMGVVNPQLPKTSIGSSRCPLQSTQERMEEWCRTTLSTSCSRGTGLPHRYSTRFLFD
jgi:hypothetical protein